MKSLTAAQGGKSGLTGGKTTQELKDEIKTLKLSAPQEVSIDQLFVREPFKSFLRIKKHKVAPIAADMKKNKFDPKMPIIVIIENGDMFIIDGHTRYAAAREANLTHVWVVILDVKVSMFRNSQTLMDNYIINYMVKLQFLRRNAEDYDYVIMAQKFQKDKDDSDNERKQFSAKFGIKPTKAGWIITIAKQADEMSLLMLEKNEISAYKLWQCIQKVKKQQDSEQLRRIGDGTLSYVEAARQIEAEKQNRSNANSATVSASVGQNSLGSDSGTAPAANTPTNSSEGVTSSPSTAEQAPSASGGNAGISNTETDSSSGASAGSSQQKTTPAENVAGRTSAPAANQTSLPAVQDSCKTNSGINQDQLSDNGGLDLPPFDVPDQIKVQVFEEYKKYLNNQKTQDPGLLVAYFREHIIALEKIGILDPSIVEFLLNKTEEL